MRGFELAPAPSAPYESGILRVYSLESISCRSPRISIRTCRRSAFASVVWCPSDRHRCALSSIFLSALPQLLAMPAGRLDGLMDPADF